MLDVVVIGAGPIGLFSVFQCGLLGLSCRIFDSLDFVGGQCIALYPEKPIYDIPGFPSVLAEDLIQNLKQQADHFSPEYHLGETIVSVSKNEDGSWSVESNKGTKIQTKAILIASGAGGFGPNRPPLDNIEDYEGTSVFYAVHKKELFRDKRIVIAGGGDSAVDWAVSLSTIAQSVHVIHRRDSFRAAPEMVSQMMDLKEKGRITLEIPFQLSKLHGNNNELTAVEIESLSGESKIIEANILLPFFGLLSDLGPIANWGLDIEKKQLTVSASTLETNQKGIFAVGDAVTYEGKLKLILCGFSEAAMAAHAIRAHIYPDQVFSFQHSTSKAGSVF